MIDVIVTGSRDLEDTSIVWQALDEVAKEFGGIGCIIQGGCPTGADLFAMQYAIDNKIPCITVPADWSKYGRSAGPRRNAEMLDGCPQALVLAFPKGRSSGTRGCIAMAEKRGMTVRVFEVK